MNISNGFYKAVQMRWDTFTFPVAEGTPVSAAGIEANSGDAIGIIPQSFTGRPLVPNCYILVSGDVDGIGYDLSSDAIKAMSSIHFLGKPAAEGGGLPSVSPDDAGKALVVSEEGEWEPGSALPPVNSNNYGDSLVVWDGEWYVKKTFAYVFVDAREDPSDPYIDAEKSIEYFFDSNNDILDDHPQFADFYYMGADGSCISEVCLILLSKSIYMGQTEVSASFESKGTGYTGTWTRSGFSLTSN